MAKRIYDDSGTNTQDKLEATGWTFVSAPERNVGKSVRVLVSWIDENCDGKYIMHSLRQDRFDSDALSCVMGFELPHDAMNVKLRWA